MADRADEPDAEAGASLESALKRLERAVTLLDGRVKELSGRADSGAGGLFDFDRSQLAAELDASRARERALEEAGEAAAEALGRAIDQVRSALHQAEEA
jgi:hypothetical protein